MTQNNSLKIYTLVLIYVFVFAGCFKDDAVDISDTADVTFSSSEEIIHYFEDRGDYINSAESPSLITAQEVYANIGSYLIIDIRSSEDYSSGHIENSVNAGHGELTDVLNSLNSNNYSKVVIVSKNGQASAYYTALLRLYGFGNVYSMNFGMAAWNREFAGNWLKAIEHYQHKGEVTISPYDRNSFSKLPDLSFSKPSLSVEERIKERVIGLLKENFPEDSVIYQDNAPSIYRSELFKMISNANYIICCGTTDTYTFQIDRGVYLGHLIGAVFYNAPPFSDFNSNRYLQTVPRDKKTFIYSADGSLSAFLTAYLRLLGYDAVSLLFGLNTIFPEYINVVPSLKQYSFEGLQTLNYPYVK